MGVFSTGLRYVLKDFSCWTSTHGVPHIGMANAMWLRTFWIIVVLICIGAFIWQLQTLLAKYLAYLVNTETKLQFSERVFPTVTMCHLNPWKIDAAKDSPIMSSLINSYQSKQPDSTFGFGDGLNGKRQRLAVKWTSLLGESLYQSPSNAEYSYDDLVISCTYNAKSCNSSNFDIVYDPSYGQCHKFNFDAQFTSSRAGPLYGLRLVIRTDQAKYLPWTETAGVVIVIHAQDEVPYPDVLGYFAPPGTASSMGVRFLSTSRCPYPYGSCTTRKKLETAYYEGNYAVEACFRSCLQEKIIGLCHCYDPTFPFKDDGTTSCSSGDANQMKINMACVDNIMGSDSSFNIIRDCNCPQPCEVESYSVTVSTAKWPSSSFRPTECTSKLSNFTSPAECVEWYNDNTLLVEIYYERMNYQILSETPSYSFVNLISDIGGQVGLFLGMSIISLIEFLFLFILLCSYCATHKKRRVELEDLDNTRKKAKDEADRVAAKVKGDKAKDKQAIKQLKKDMYEDDADPQPPAIMKAD